MKKSFILHRDSLDVLDELTDEQAGQLFKAIKDFQNGNAPVLDHGLNLLFITFRNQFIRDNEKYKTISDTNKINGSKGGKRNQANATDRKRTKANQADSDSDSVNVSDSVNENEIINQSFLMFWDMYDHKQDRKKCESIWSKIPPSEYSRIFAHVPTYVKSTPDKQFRKHPKTYLNQEAWNNEVIASALSKPEEKYVSQFKDLGW